MYGDILNKSCLSVYHFVCLGMRNYVLMSIIFFLFVYQKCIEKKNRGNIWGKLLWLCVSQLSSAEKGDRSIYVYRNIEYPIVASGLATSCNSGQTSSGSQPHRAHPKSTPATKGRAATDSNNAGNNNNNSNNNSNGNGGTNSQNRGQSHTKDAGKKVVCCRVDFDKTPSKIPWNLNFSQNLHFSLS